MLLVDFAQTWIGDMSINLRRLNRGMPKHRLDAANVCPIDEQVGGIGMAERMRRNMLGDTGGFGIMINQALD